MTHYVPSREKEKHVATTTCICAPRLFQPVGDLTGKRAYWEHFALDGRKEERQVFH